MTRGGSGSLGWIARQRWLFLVVVVISFTSLAASPLSWECDRAPRDVCGGTCSHPLLGPVHSRRVMTTDEYEFRPCPSSAGAVVGEFFANRDEKPIVFPTG